MSFPTSRLAARRSSLGLRLATACLVVAIPALATAQAPRTGSVPSDHGYKTLGTIGDVRRLTPQKASLHYPVDITATVTFIDPIWRTVYVAGCDRGRARPRQDDGDGARRRSRAPAGRHRARRSAARCSSSTTSRRARPIRCPWPAPSTRRAHRAISTTATASRSTAVVQHVTLDALGHLTAELVDPRRHADPHDRRRPLAAAAARHPGGRAGAGDRRPRPARRHRAAVAHAASAGRVVRRRLDDPAGPADLRRRDAELGGARSPDPGASRRTASAPAASSPSPTTPRSFLEGERGAFRLRAGVGGRRATGRRHGDRSRGLLRSRRPARRRCATPCSTPPARRRARSSQRSTRPLAGAPARRRRRPPGAAHRDLSRRLHQGPGAAPHLLDRRRRRHRHPARSATPSRSRSRRAAASS